MNDTSIETKRHYKRGALRFLIVIVFGVILPIAIVSGGVYGFRYLMKTSPKAERNQNARREQQARLVEAMPLVRGEHQVLVEAMGKVTAARRVGLQSQVGGGIVFVHDRLVPGGQLRAGEIAVRIDPADYRLAVQQREAQVAQAQSDLRIEMGQQKIAKQEFELLQEEIPTGDASLALREPQLEKARANLAAAQTAVDDAKLDLKRTEVAVPFNSLVVSENAETGTVVSSQTQLAELVGTDRYWVELSVPVDELRWLHLPGNEGEPGSLVRIYDNAAWGPKVYRTGYVVRFTGIVDEESRMTGVIVEVEDPLGLLPENDGQPRLLLASYVRAEIEGIYLNDVVALAREFLHENGTVWIMNEENRLEIRPVEIVWRGPQKVLISAGIEHGEKVVTSRLSSPVEGMLLRTRTMAEMQQKGRVESRRNLEEILDRSEIEAEPSPAREDITSASGSSIHG